MGLPRLRRSCVSHGCAFAQAEGVSALALDKGAVERVMDRVRDAQLRPVRGLLVRCTAGPSLV